MRILISFVATLAFLGVCDPARAAKDASTRASALPPRLRLQDGDLVFHRSRSAQSAAVGAATRSRHMGVVLVDVGDRPWLARPPV